MKNLFYSFHLIFLAMIFQSCELSTPIVFDGSERYSVQGRVLDKDGNPMANIWVYVRTCQTNTNCALCNYTKTRNDGRFEILHSVDDAAFYSIHINDYVLGKPDIYPNSKYHNKSIKYNLSEYESYTKDFGDIGFLDKAVGLKVFCNSNSCQFSINSNKMDNQLSGFDDQDKRHKYYTIENYGTKTIYVPENDTIQVEYKQLQPLFLFIPLYGWEKRTIIVKNTDLDIRL